MNSELHQLMLERVQMLESALRRAIAGIATQADWEMICTECGVPKESFSLFLKLGANDELDSER